MPGFLIGTKRGIGEPGKRGKSIIADKALDLNAESAKGRRGIRRMGEVFKAMVMENRGQAKKSIVYSSQLTP